MDPTLTSSRDPLVTIMLYFTVEKRKEKRRKEKKRKKYILHTMGKLFFSFSKAESSPPSPSPSPPPPSLSLPSSAHVSSAKVNSLSKRLKVAKVLLFPRSRMQVWIIRLSTSILVWTCLLQVLALGGQLWGPYHSLLHGWPSCFNERREFESEHQDSSSSIIPVTTTTTTTTTTATTTVSHTPTASSFVSSTSSLVPSKIIYSFIHFFLSYYLLLLFDDYRLVHIL